MLGGMQNFSRSMNQRPNRKTTIGRNRLRTNQATIVISGIARKQIWPSPTLPELGGRAGVELQRRARAAATSAPGERADGFDAAAAASVGKSGSWTLTGRCAVPTGSKCAASRNGSVGRLQNELAVAVVRVGVRGHGSWWRRTKQRSS